MGVLPTTELTHRRKDMLDPPGQPGRLLPDIAGFPVSIGRARIACRAGHHRTRRHHSEPDHLPGPRLQRAAHQADRLSQGVFLDHPARPHRGQQLVLGDDLVAVRHQVQQYVKGLAVRCHQHALGPEQETQARVDAITVESQLPHPQTLRRIRICQSLSRVSGGIQDATRR